MTAHQKLTYPTKAKVEHAIRMAKLAGISEIGSIELGPDGTIRIEAPTGAASSADDELARWRAKRGK